MKFRVEIGPIRAVRKQRRNNKSALKKCIRIAPSSPTQRSVVFVARVECDYIRTAADVFAMIICIPHLSHSALAPAHSRLIFLFAVHVVINDFVYLRSASATHTRSAAARSTAEHTLAFERSLRFFLFLFALRKQSLCLHLRKNV